MHHHAEVTGHRPISIRRSRSRKTSRGRARIRSLATWATLKCDSCFLANTAISHASTSRARRQRWGGLFAARFGLLLAIAAFPASLPLGAAERPPFKLTWEDNFLTIHGSQLPGKQLRIHYLEAYCRPGSTDRDWSQTVIRHRATLVAADGNRIQLKDELGDGVIVEHTITSSADAVDFHLVAHNPTDRRSDVDWAQPCIRVDQFTGCRSEDARKLYPPYIRQCFLFLDGRLTRLPTTPWASQARYTPGQVYVPQGVDRNDVNPRPLSELVPSSGLCGCFSADGKQVMAVAWEPYQEIFQGVITCLHSDFRIGGLNSGETKNIRGKIYLMPADIDRLVRRYEQDFPEQATRAAQATGEGKR